MTRSTKAERELETLLKAAFEAGLDCYREHPDALLVEIYRKASARYTGSRNEAFEFVRGYSTARRRVDDYRRE